MIIIYSTLSCPYCNNAKALLDKKGVEYKEILVDKDPSQLKEMLAKSNGRRTVPQIFIDGKHIGGFDDLKDLNDSGKLDALLRK
jgi:glutaredoxin 3